MGLKALFSLFWIDFFFVCSCLSSSVELWREKAPKRLAVKIGLLGSAIFDGISLVMDITNRGNEPTHTRRR